MADPPALWERFAPNICDDLPRLLAQRDDVPDQDNVHLDYGLFLLQRILADHGKSLTDYGLPLFQHAWERAEGNPLLAAELRYDPAEEGRLRDNCCHQLNTDQAACFNAIVTAISTDPQNAHFFLQGPAGTGKTFLYRCLCHYYRAQGKVVLCVASSGIAALLLPGGRTAHSRFRIPLDVNESSTCSVPKNSHLADLLRTTSLIIWDEVPMQHKYCFEAVHRMLSDICSNDRSLFGGIPTVFGGDFAQILPVIKRGSRAQIVDACLQRSFLWPSFRILTLRQNMRVRHGEENQHFADWVRSLSCDMSKTGSIKLLPSITRFPEEEPFYSHIYPSSLLERAHVDPQTFRNRAIFTVRNDTVAEINNDILKRLNGSEEAFLSVDTAELDDETQDLPPPELL